MTVFVAFFICTNYVNAATEQDLIDYASKTFTINGKEFSSPELAAIVKSYLKDNDISSSDADKIIAKADQIMKIVNDAKVTDVTKLSKSQKDEIRALATDAATIAGATISYDYTTKQLTVTGSNGKNYGKASLKENKLQGTGVDYSIYVGAIAGILLIGGLGLSRKLKVDAK